MLVKGFVEGDGISLAIYGGERATGREPAATLVVTGRAPVERIRGPDAREGKHSRRRRGLISQQDVRDARSTRGRALIGVGDWKTSYEGGTRVIRVGTKPKKKPRPRPKSRRRLNRGRRPTYHRRYPAAPRP